MEDKIKGNRISGKTHVLRTKKLPQDPIEYNSREKVHQNALNSSNRCVMQNLNKTIVISKFFHPHVVHAYKQSIIRVKPSSCHT